MHQYNYPITFGTKVELHGRFVIIKFYQGKQLMVQMKKTVEDSHSKDLICTN